MKFSPRLRPRLTRLRGNIVGNIYKYYPVTFLTRKESIENGTLVKVLTEPQGKGKHKILDVIEIDYRKQEKGEKFSVLLQDLSIII